MDATSDVVSAWQAIEYGVTPQATKDQEKYWKAWQHYATTCNSDPFLQGCDQLDIIIVVTAFVARIWQGYYGKGVQIKVLTIAKALSDITTSIHLVGKSCPFKTTEDDYILHVKLLIDGLQRGGPPPIPQLALPTSVPNDCCARGILSKSPYIQETGDLSIIGFYYILRCGEYTAPRYVQFRDGTLMRTMRTNQFTVGDVGLWKGGCKIPCNSSLHLLLQADSATLKITYQKNGRMGKTIHH